MAEFTEVLMKRNEMCNAYKTCAACPLCDFHPCNDFCALKLPALVALEKIVMNWEQPIDWTKVEVDTPILVSCNGRLWFKRYFARYENGAILAFSGGATSWTTEDTID